MRRMIEHQWTLKLNANAKTLRHVAIAVVIACCFPVVNSAFAQQPAENALPPNFNPPRPAPKELALENELVTAEEVAAWKKKKLDFQKSLGLRALNPAAEKDIAEGLRVNVLQLSLTSERNNLTDLRKSILRDLDQNAKNADVRIFANKVVVARCKELLDGNFNVRCAAVLLMTDLDVNAAGIDPVKDPPKSYIEVVPDLLDVLNPPAGGIDQPEGVRILAADGVKRQFQFGRSRLKPNSKTPNDAAVRLLAELAASGTEWYYWSLMEAAVETAVPTVQMPSGATEPAIIDALSRMVADPMLSYRLRCHAVREMGRVAMPGGILPDPIAWSVAQLSAEVGNRATANQLHPVIGFYCLQDIFLGFKGQVGEMTTDGRQKSGLLSISNQLPIQNAYKDFVPLFSTVFRQFQVASKDRNGTGIPQLKIPGGFIQKLAAWPAPAVMSISNGLKPITVPYQQRKNAAATPKAVPQAGGPVGNAPTAG